MITHLAPATDEEIAALEKALTDQDIHTAHGDVILKLIARIQSQNDLVGALRTIANRRSVIFGSTQSMSANEAFGIATNAITKAGVK